MKATQSLVILATLYFAPFLIVWPSLMCQAAVATDLPRHVAVLNSPSEPGDAMVLTGQVTTTDGEAPADGVEVYVYHTDIQGYYSGRTTRSDNPRIHGTLVTDAEGRYEIHSIRPGAYPERGVPAHVHFVVRRGDGAEQRFEMHFEGDALLSERQLERSRQRGRFGSVRPLNRDDEGVWRGTFDMRLKD